MVDAIVGRYVGDISQVLWTINIYVFDLDWPHELSPSLDLAIVTQHNVSALIKTLISLEPHVEALVKLLSRYYDSLSRNDRWSY